jgi:hypothetical protein
VKELIFWNFDSEHNLNKIPAANGPEALWVSISNAKSVQEMADRFAALQIMSYCCE